MPEATLADWITAVSAGIGVISAIIGVIYANRQLKNGVDQLGQMRLDVVNGIKELQINQLSVVLEIESQINDRKVLLDKTSREVRELSLAANEQEKLDIVIDYQKTAVENYLNALDRLCFCIMHDFVPEKDWKAEYRNLMHNTILQFPDRFAAGSPYKNMLDLDNKWQRGI